ncbi:MAG: hypothetical protein ACMXYE_03960 [Candidatus Woesearchaeota archaeon]
MVWKKLLETKDLIAYEKTSGSSTARIEARYKNGRWRVYKTFNNKLKTGLSSVREYIASSRKEVNFLVNTLRKEKDVSKTDIFSEPISISIERCYKEEYVEKWRFTIDDFNSDNFVIVHFDSEIKLDIIIHEHYNAFERVILERLISALGLKNIGDKICYDFFYFRKHSAKRRIYQKPDDEELVAQLEFNLGSEE